MGKIKKIYMVSMLHSVVNNITGVFGVATVFLYHNIETAIFFALSLSFGNIIGIVLMGFMSSQKKICQLWDFVRQ